MPKKQKVRIEVEWHEGQTKVQFDGNPMQIISMLVNLYDGLTSNSPLKRDVWLAVPDLADKYHEARGDKPAA